MSSDYLEGVFQSKWLSKFINKGILKGRKTKFEKFVYCSFFCLKKKLMVSPLFIFFEALEKLKPSAGLRLYIKGNTKKKRIKACPVILTFGRQYTKSIYWVLKAIQLRKELFLNDKLFGEFDNIVFNESVNPIKMKKDYYNYIVMFKSVKRFNW
jgi:small subunit ribosomal protein S7